MRIMSVDRLRRLCRRPEWFDLGRPREFPTGAGPRGVMISICRSTLLDNWMPDIYPASSGAASRRRHAAIGCLNVLLNAPASMPLLCTFRPLGGR